MKNTLSLLVIAVLLFASCREKEPVVIVLENAVTDYDGNTYDAVQIGRQVWMKENLRTTHYADGTPLDDNQYYLVEEPFNAPEEYGYLYIDDAAALGGSQSNDATGSIQGICPDGWHLPSKYEWLILHRYVEQFTDDVVGALCAPAGWGPDTNGIHDQGGHQQLWLFRPPVPEDGVLFVQQTRRLFLDFNGIRNGRLPSASCPLLRYGRTGLLQQLPIRILALPGPFPGCFRALRPRQGNRQ